ncbi:arylsulfotransferase [Salmonella enterica subsp. enterica]|uniref:Arylsulfotransferase n=1 Tax=Salmonella enterica I TaxID=59201 RepID=A0A447PRU0_SALET|nr:arylsulfotransferase [Salmonella enterica subsp. enterica]
MDTTYGWLVPSKSTGGKTVVTAFDNGDARGMEQPAMPSMKYSAAWNIKLTKKI